MELFMRTAHIIEPVPYQDDQGRRAMIPVGPCLVERQDGLHVDVIWGTGHRGCATLSMAQLEQATLAGYLLMVPSGVPIPNPRGGAPLRSFEQRPLAP